MIANINSPNQESCRQLCNSNEYAETCKFFTFFPENTYCILISDATCDLDTECLGSGDRTCVHGNRDCEHNGSVNSSSYYSIITFEKYFLEESLSKILVVGGFSTVSGVIGETDFSEVIDLINVDSTCGNITRYPRIDSGMVGTHLSGKVMICGGSFTNECYGYDVQNNSWSALEPMREVRHYPAATLILGGSEWWITGGRVLSTANGQNKGYIDSTEILRNGKFVKGPDLPEKMAYHCILSVNHTHVMLVGGIYFSETINNTIDSNRTYMIDITNEYGWVPLEDMKSKRHGSGCHMVETEEFGKEIVVAGGSGLKSTEIFSLTNETWREGPPLPNYVTYTSYVDPAEEFLLVGGLGKESVQYDEMFKLDTSTEEWQWRKQFTTLTFPTRNPTVIDVGKYIKC